MGFGERRRQAVRWVIGCDLFKSSICMLSLLDGEEKEEASYNSEEEMFSGSRYNGASATPEYNRFILTSGLWTDACSISPFVWVMSEGWETIRSRFFQMLDLSALVAMAGHLFLVVQHFSFTADVDDCRYWCEVFIDYRLSCHMGPPWCLVGQLLIFTNVATEKWDFGFE